MYICFTLWSSCWIDLLSLSLFPVSPDAMGSPVSARDRYGSPAPKYSLAAVRRLFEAKPDPVPPQGQLTPDIHKYSVRT